MGRFSDYAVSDNLHNDRSGLCDYLSFGHGRLTSGSRGVPSPNMEAKVRTFGLQETIEIWLVIIKVGS